MDLLLHELDHTFDIIALTETWNSENEKNNFTPGILENYEPYLGLTGSSLKGGCGIYIKKYISYRLREDLNIKCKDTRNEFECLWIEVINKKTDNIIIGLNYRHPRYTDNKYLNYLAKTLKIINKENKQIILTGDFNYNLLKHEKSKNINEFLNIITRNLLSVQIIGPTRFVEGQIPSLVDNIFVNSIDKNVISGNLFNQISEHLPNFLIIQDFYDTKTYLKNEYKRDWKHFKEKEFLDDLNIDELENYIDNEQDINLKYENFEEYIIGKINKHAPLKIISKREKKQNKKPWITKGIKKSINIRNNLLEQIVNSNNAHKYDKYKLYRNKINHLIRSSKNNYYNKIFNENKQNMKKTWIEINNILHKKNNKSSSQICIIDNGQLINDHKNVGNKFNNFFTTIANKLVGKIPQCKKTFNNYLNNPNTNSFFVSPTTPNEVENIIKSINKSTTPDIYGIIGKFIKIIGFKISNVLSHLINESFITGIFPNRLKVALIIPIYKSGSKLEVTNYRPISILPFFSKIIEKIMHKRLMSFLENNNTLYKHQYGFQKNKNTSHAVLDLYADLINAIDNKKIACSVFLDFAKAFDTVNHAILLKKLEYYGIRGISNNWFKSYLSNRSQKVKIGECLSDEMEINCGVPQGSVLGPILFLLYINDINESSDKLKFFLFADDTSTLLIDDDAKKIEKIYNEELLNIYDWLNANKLSLNITKSNMVIFKSSRKKNANIILKLGAKFIEEKNYTKYLGILLDNHLTWKSHIHYINLKISKGIGILMKMRHYVSKSLLKTLYYSFIQSHIDYGIMNWGCAAFTTLDPIRRSIRRALRVITFKNNDDDIELIVKDLNILDFDRFKSFMIGKFIWKLENGFLPETLNKHFSKRKKYRNIENSELELAIPVINCELKRRFISYTGIKVWRTIPLKIRNNTTLCKFTSELKMFFLN